MKKSRWLWLGAVQIALAFVWYFAISPHWQQRFPAGWGQEFNFIGISTPPDLTIDQFPPADLTGVYQRIFEVVERRAGAVTLQDQYVIRDSLTGQITYNYVFRADVDPITGAHLDAKYQGDYYVFPHEVEQKTYHIRNSYIKGVPVAFQREEQVEGLQAYLFSYHGPAEYTESYLGMADALGRKVEVGQEVRCADDQFRLDFWVEPVTGEVLKFAESCYAGDYVYDVATGKALFPVLRWGAVTAGDDVQGRVDSVRVQRTYYLWMVRYIPLFLFGTGLLCFTCLIYLFLVSKIRKALDDA
jgi:hypothetical protein